MHLDATKARRLPPDVLRAAKPREALIEWQRRHGLHGALPTRADFDPLTIPGLLGHLMILDVYPPPVGFRVRLFGTGVVDLLDADWTGLSVDAHNLGPLGGYVAAALETTRDSRAPTAGANTLHRDRHGRVEYEVVRLPLAGDAQAITQILACVQAL
ncbi:PAS domain-containing protein [Limimonas halophila]|uniref:PAS domain-containing protein n=1 Tax=Limimonas halophila TaxID=1082479 RepID=A0A1G7TC09_9PROT|nr:PAS domain-containing protein [Limimonas halophila]SDG32838.1 PAS domain-containing protein [Limimonas halophila]